MFVWTRIIRYQTKKTQNRQVLLDAAELLLTKSRLMAFALVYYTVIGDRDDPAHPNAFPMNKPLDTILVGDIAENFPLNGEFQCACRCDPR